MGSSKSDNNTRESHYYPNELSPTQMNGLNYSAGIVTSIPYESVPADLNRQPIPLPHGLRPASRGDEQVTPHALGKFGDFHQYPQVHQSTDQQQQHLRESGQRPQPSQYGSSPSTATLNSQHQQYQQGYVAYNSSYQPPSPYSNSTFPPRQQDAHSQHQPHHHQQPYYGSNASDSTYQRSSSDQASIYSSISSATRNSIASIAPSIGELIPSPMNFSSADGFTLERPRDDREVERMFRELMEKRGFSGLPEHVQRGIMAYPTSKKWILIHQDKLAEYQTGRERWIAAQSRERDPDEGGPEWYVKKIMDGTISVKQLGSLSVSLRTQPIRYIIRRDFISFHFFFFFC